MEKWGTNRNYSELVEISIKPHSKRHDDKCLSNDTACVLGAKYS